MAKTFATVKEPYIELVGNLQKPQMDMKSRDIWSQNTDVT